jgi:hypothetical protein
MPNNYDTSDIASISAPDNGSDIVSITAPQDTNTSISQDVLQGIRDVPSIAWQGIKSLPGEAYGVLNQVSTDPMRALANAATGAVNTGKGIANFPSNTMQYLNKKGLVSDKAANFFPRSYLDKTDVAQLMGVKGPQQAGDLGIQGLTGYGPFGAAGEIGTLSTLGRVGARSGAAGAYGASQGQNPLTAALLGPATEGMIKAPIAGAQALSQVNRLRPSSLLSGNLSNEELARNLKDAQGTNTPLPDVIGSPGLKKTFESGIAEVPFSGTDKIYKKVSDQVSQKGLDILKGLEQKDNINTSIDPDLMVKKLINNAKSEQESRKNSLYNERNRLSEEEKFSPDLKNFQNLVRNKNTEIDESTLYKNIPGFKALMNRTGGLSDASGKTINSSIIDQYGKPLVSKEVKPTLQEAQTLSSDLYTKGQDLKNSMDGSQRSLGREYMGLYKALTDDINRSINENASPELREAHNNAQGNYKTNFSKFLDKDLKKVLNKGEDEKDYEAIVRSLVNPSKTFDKASKINRIQSLLPEGNENSIGYAYLRPALEENGFNPNKMSSLIEKLGNRQFKALFPEKETRDQLKSYSNLVGMNKESLDRMRNPKTGYRGIPAILYGALVGGAGAVARGATLGAGANVASRYLTNPNTREKMVNAIIKQQTKGLPKGKMNLTLNKFKGYSDPLINQGLVPYDINNQGNK